MKSLFYGAAVATLSGLLLGAGFKAPLAMEDFQSSSAETFILAEPEAERAPYQPAYLSPIVTPASYTTPADQDLSMGATLRPAVYTTEVEPETPAPEAYAPAAERTYAFEPPAPLVIASTDAVAPEAPVERSQGFYVLQEAPDPS